MTQQTYRANLTAAEFPMISEFQGRTVIVPGEDQNYSRVANSKKNKDRDIGIPQVYYCHNIIPTDAGVTTVGYLGLASAPADTDNSFQDTFTVRDINDNVAILNATSSGRNYVLPNISTGWLRTTDITIGVNESVTTAHVNGETYVYFGKVGCYKYNFSTNVMDAVTLTGLTSTDILGIAASSGYMIAWTANKVFWSSNIDPTDFLPSLVTGSGSQSLQEAKGALVSCLPQNSGFIVYCKKNAVSALFTNNIQYPFAFKEIIGCGGLSTANLVAYDGNSTNHYAYTTSGIQEISGKSSTTVFAEITDFIAGSRFEDFDETTYIFTQTELAVPMKKKIVLISNRYLVISYGVTSLTHALVYDNGLNRWGKLKIEHVDCFDFTYPATEVIETPRRSIGFVQANGTVKVAILSYATSSSYGTVILGKYQHDRNRYVTMQEVHMESVREGNILNVTWLTSIDGKNTSVAPATLAVSTGTYRRYNSFTTGLNHSLVISGGFNLHSLALKFTDAGAVQ